MNTARQLLLEKKSFWSGMEGQLLSQDLADLLNVPGRASGYLVRTVARNSPGEAMGVRGGTKTITVDGEPVVVGGDIVMSVDGIPVGNAGDLVKIRDHMNALRPGSPFKARVLRQGQEIELTGTAR